MKKIIYLILCFTIIFSLVACDNGKNSNDVKNNKNEITTNQDAIEILINNKWECSALLAKGTRENIPMESVYGTSIETNKGVLVFYEDGVFKNIRPGNLDENLATNGIYSIDKDVVVLKYDDNRVEEGRIKTNSTIEIETDGYIMVFSKKNKLISAIDIM